MTATVACVEEFRTGEDSPGRVLRPVEFAGPEGLLEGLVNEGAPEAEFAALVCHPHPLGGGNLHNKVVYNAMKVANDRAWGLGWPVLRFNFRGVGRSHGRYHGQAESADVAAAIAWIENAYNRPVVVMGFSFGAAMVLRACAELDRSKDRIRGVAALGLPVRVRGLEYDYAFLSGCAIAKLFISGDRDEFTPPEVLRELVSMAHEPKQMAQVAGADHFFTGQLRAMQNALHSWLSGLIEEQSV
jgi:hypothetical protein